MADKSFVSALSGNNPALQFINPQVIAQSPVVVKAVKRENPIELPAVEVKPDKSEDISLQKNQPERPVETHQSGIVRGIKQPAASPAPVVTPSKKELKSKRINILVQPSLYADIERIAHVQEISSSEAVSIALRNFRKKNLPDLNKYWRIKAMD
jgi:hypothetical protein